MAGLFDIANSLANLNAQNPATAPFNPTFAQSQSGLLTPGGTSTLGDLASSIGSVGGTGGMDVALARAAGLAGGGPFTTGITGGFGGALVPYSSQAATAATNPLVAALQQAGIGTNPFVQAAGTTAIPMGAGGESTLGATLSPEVAQLLARGGAMASEGAPIAPGIAQMLSGATAPAAATGLEGAAGGGGLLARMLSYNLPSVSPGSLLGGRSLMGLIKGTPGVAADEAAGTAAVEGTAGLLNPWSIAPTLGALGVNAVLPSSKPRQILADTLAGAGVGAGVASVVPVLGTALGAGIGGIGGALVGLFHNKNAAQPMTLDQGTTQLNKIFNAAKLDQTARDDIMGQYQTAWATQAAQEKSGNLTDAEAKTLTQQATAMVPQERSTMVDRLATQMEQAQYLPQIMNYMQPSLDRMNNSAQNTYNLIAQQADAIGGARGAYVRAGALQQLADAQRIADTYRMAAPLYGMNQSLQNQAATGQSVGNSQLNAALVAALGGSPSKTWSGTLGSTGATAGGTSTGTGTYASALQQALSGG